MPVFAMNWEESLTGKQTNLESLADDQVVLRRLEEEMGKPKTIISAMGLPASNKYIDFLLEHDVERMILSVPNDSVATCDEAIEKYQHAISEYK